MNSATAPTQADEAAAAAATAEGRVRAYHQRTKHHLQRYAAGPETLDWDALPDPFRRWAGAPLEMLPLRAAALPEGEIPAWDDLFTAGAVRPKPADRNAIGLLFELSLALAAWKQHGPDRWAVRINPSSGNLHPTEAYLLAQGVLGLEDGLYHYAPREHALEQRARAHAGSTQETRLWIGLSSIHWREAWKYGERAFRYCQLDVGHALGALRYAAAVLGWRAQVVEGLGDMEIATLLGLDRDADFQTAEREVPDCVVELLPSPTAQAGTVPDPAQWLMADSWRGQANRLDKRPMYRWPVIADVSAASERPQLPAEPHEVPPASRADAPAAPAVTSRSAVELIRTRRSAQRFDRRAVMPLSVLTRLVRALQPGALPWDVLGGPVRIHPVLFAHRVEGLAPGAYALPRSAAGDALLRAALGADMEWQAVDGLPLWRLAENPALAGTMRTINCHQSLGSDAALAVAMLAEYDGALADAPWRYRELLVEAGLLGHVLYLQAEACGFNGTGIGCYFDDALHELLGMEGTRMQSVYHFTVGAGQYDPRIQSTPPYAGREEYAWTPEPSNA